MLLLLMCLSALSAVTRTSDEVKSLPGLDYIVNFKHYSGYLQASSTRFIHYWFVESQNARASDSLIVWFHGGPGLSSMRAMLKENGPFRLSSSGRTIKPNPHSWNKFANVLYMESPVGVGFSYAVDQNVTNDDLSASTENYEALKQFYVRYPDFRNRSLFLTGEEYSARSVAWLAKRLLDSQFEYQVNLQGILVADSDPDTDLTVSSHWHYAHSLRLMGERNWKQILSSCCANSSEDDCIYKYLAHTKSCFDAVCP